MKNIIVANYREKKTNSAKQYKKERLEKEIRFQIDNSIELGWNKSDLWVITNFPFAYKNVGAIQLPLNTNCLTGSKLFAMRSIFDNKLHTVDSLFWIHDLDLLQVNPFAHKDIDREMGDRDCGLATYSKRHKFNGGCMYYRDTAEDIVRKLCEHIEKNDQAKEEPTLDMFLHGEFEDRTRVMNETHNVGSSGFTTRFERAKKPIYNIHCSLNTQAYDTFFRGKHGPETVAASHRLKELYDGYYSDKIEKFRYEDEVSPFQQRTAPIDREKAIQMKLVRK